ncbi:LysR family transcriptional regulator [Paraburkholderia caballeronis]|uniref:DNA-binding transcriptional regulator, LysR family n=1 Tax=Paraburkholderia caballeronis TaxID=416943 RepID=A0A1H7LHE5_9BURK|nr:LysR family transcriptional regulator [Paraburkholderia caballeronis]PXW28464.1 LysR family transcriptional regulator [Paraburkholderia caballeronis]PXX03830.1 LysR family transcriptional regulator [Paraburkholderia caballeronis]RAK04574.1 LysR family transcriptional regulator [Paraburkholderia caballeronis]SED74459.1 transcriptional regulator, LysR family [Paraburkholderia caballeronis]SEK98361.1 DNA-binding transcriptional regulator, LysR family [Paraburkholderia caballeronis]
MKLDEIEAFVAVVQSPSLSHAAESLQLTQPAVTRRIQNFEETLGVELFDRNTRPLKATPMGRVVYEQCRAIVREVDALLHLVTDDASLAGVLRIGVAQTVADVALPGALQALRKAHPDLHARVSTGWGGPLLQKVGDGELDAAAVLLPANRALPDALAGASLGTLKLAVVARKGALKKRPHTLAECQSLGWVLNPDGCGFRAGLQHALAGQGHTLKLNLETLGTELQLGLVADGVGLGLVPLPLLQASPHAARLDVVQVSDFRPEITVWIVHPRAPGRMQTAISVLADSVAQQFDAARLARAA